MKNVWGQEIRPERWAGRTGHAYPEEPVLYPGGGGEPGMFLSWPCSQSARDSEGRVLNKHTQVGGGAAAQGREGSAGAGGEGTSPG